LKHFLLPIRNWQWENDWYIEDNLEGEPLGQEGWTYSIDFPMEFTAERKWNSLVRRRKWMRHCRYLPISQWALIDSIHGDHCVEPFIDISTGGWNVPGQSDSSCNHIAVWAVTIMGRVMYRTDVTRLSPEGKSWQNIPLADQGREANQISCGPTGLVWAVSWDGSALVRIGVTRENLCGESWMRVESPLGTDIDRNDKSESELSGAKLTMVTVGVDAVWALTRDGRVWFRKGIRGANAGKK